jgi:glutamyl-tRNA reductase
MKLLLVGLSHKTAPVEIRERLAFDPSSLPPALKELRSLPCVQEGLILSTCNRTEVLVSTTDVCNGQRDLCEFLEEMCRLEPGWLASYLYWREGPEAIRHLFRVAASLDSMMVGEPQILGQLKAAFVAARAEGSVGAFLDSLLTRAFSVAKRVRSETGIGRSAVSISYAAVELAREIFGSLNGRNVLIVGAGKMSELAARHLRSSGSCNIWVTNRTTDRARELAALFQGSTVDYDQFKSRLREMDIIITSSGAPDYILRRDEMRRALEARKNRPIFVIDIAVPRNVDPAVNQLENIYLYDIDDLQQIVSKNRETRLKEAEMAEEIIEAEVQQMLGRLRVREVAPTIVSLQEQLELIRRAEISRIRSKLGNLTPKQEEALEMLTKGIINKIAHGPISELRRRAGEPDGVVVDTIRKVFQLETE